jgi:tRNA (mo5U34)-methyltransferase
MTDSSGEASLTARLAAHEGQWWHSIDLGNGRITRGHKSHATLAAELGALRLPSLAGKSVLDIGAWDGYFSFAAERLGASRVVALDYYVWSLDIPEQQRYLEECRGRGVAPRPYHEVQAVWKPDSRPGKKGFDLAHEALGSNVESVVADFAAVDTEQLGTFDVVLFLGVLYHLEDPLGALRRLARLTRQVAIIESEVVIAPPFDRHSVVEFYPSDELAGDPTNWWTPTLPALIGMCRAAGFADVRSFVPFGRLRKLSRLLKAGARSLTRTGLARYRPVVHASPPSL